MTQQQYAQPQYPGYPPQQPQQGPPEWAQPQPPQWTPPGQPVQQYQQPYPPQGYGQPQAPAQQLAQGNLDDFFNQRSAGSGPGLSWSNKDGSKKPIGFWYAGVVARDIGNGDIQQQTTPQGQPQFFRDGSPKFQMLVPLKQVQAADGSQELENGEGTWYVRGQARDELTRAMAEAGCTYQVPKAGDAVVVILTGRRSSGQGFQPANVFEIRYQPAPHNLGGQAQAPVSGAPSPAPEAQQAPAPQVQQPPAPPAAPQVQQPPAQQYAQGGYVPPQGQAPAQPPAAPQGAPVPPAGLDPNAQNILAQLTGQAPA